MLKACAAMVAAAVAGVMAGPAAADGPLTLTYQATMLGLPLASAAAEVAPADGSYHLVGEIETRGIVGLFSRWQHRAVSIGRLGPDGRRIGAVRHRGDGVRNGEVRFVQILFDADGAQIEAAQPDPDDRSERRRVPPEMKLGTLDPLSAFYALALKLEAGQGCDGTLRIFDGRHRYDLDLFAGSEPLTCGFGYRPLAGFKRMDQPAVDARAASPGTIRYVRLAEGFPPIPYRLDVTSRWGTVTVMLEEWRLPGQLAAQAPPAQR